MDIDVIARRTPGFVGADLANLVNEAALLSARRDKEKLGMPEFEEAIDRVMAGPERKSRVISEKEREIIAYHEAGHALVAAKIKGTDPVHKISIIPRGHMALGYTLQLPEEDRFLVSKQELSDRICVLLGWPRRGDDTLRRRHDRRVERPRARDADSAPDGDAVRHERQARPRHARTQAARGVPRPRHSRRQELQRRGRAYDRPRNPRDNRTAA